MGKDEIIRMAIESGFSYEPSTNNIMAVDGYSECRVRAGLERFAALVAAHEREACAKVVESGVLGHGECAAAIRAINFEGDTGFRPVSEMVAEQDPVEREHITDGSSCWCNPELNYKDPETGAEVWVHKEPQ